MFSCDPVAFKYFKFLILDSHYLSDKALEVVGVTVRRLREKIEDEKKGFKYIKTKRGVGYFFASDNGEA